MTVADEPATKVTHEPERAPGTPLEVDVKNEPRTPAFDATLGISVDTSFSHDQAAEPPHRLVVIGDSLSHGFQSGAIYNTDISYPAIIAYELGWFDRYRYPTYGGPGGLPLNIEYLLRDLEHRYGANVDWWELPGAIFHSRQLMDEIEDYWERGPGSLPPTRGGFNHDLSVYGWDLRDALKRTAATIRESVKTPKDDLLKQIVENNSQIAALRVYPAADEYADDTLFDTARRLGEDTNGGAADCGIETLVVFLGANNALQTVTKLKVVWSEDDGYQDLEKKSQYTVWRPSHFEAELAEILAVVKTIRARHVIWCTVPHVTIPPISRGVGSKIRPGSRYFPYYTRPWIEPSKFDVGRDPSITGAEARGVDSAIDQYNNAICKVVEDARRGQLEGDKGPRDWYVLDVAGVLDRVAARRYIENPNARPDWWSPYPMPPALAALVPPPDSHFLASDGNGGRGSGGLFALDGVHPTTIGYGIIAQEMINVMSKAGVAFRTANGKDRAQPVSVDFERLIRRDTLVGHPPQNLSSSLRTLGWADETLDLFTRALSFTL
jgi:hypothetical protein